ncbi:hypothetical protein WJX75_002826 [Coccomyxa subellipsoidea]|uniref:Rad4-domain-containing protein n=1 Tax=Coccomyxa subellipsoidea TaxID=248742 RepID=A0ABR2YNE9_9CHLO
MGEDKPGDTLADVSGRKLQDLLEKSQRRGRHPIAASSVVAIQCAAAHVEGLPGTRQAALAGNCGAPAKRDRDQASPEGLDASGDELDMYGSDGSSSEGDEWEAIAQPPPHTFPQGHMELNIDAPDRGKGEEEGSHSKRQGPLTREEKMMHAWLKYYKSVANKEKAQLAKALHRANLLCLLAHGILLDQAANEPLVQALAMSIADPETLPDMHAKKGIRSSSLHPITTWFNGAFRQLSANEAAQKADEGTSGRVDAAAERLQQVASLKEGTGEELVALFVAIMRSVGLLARTVRALDVLPLKPSRSEGRGKGRGAGQPSRHKPASAKPAGAPKAPRESRSPKRRRAATPEPLERMSSEQQRKRKGDMEYENQMAMALQASLAGAAETTPSVADVKTGAIPARSAGRAVDAKAVAAVKRSIAAASSSGQTEPKATLPAQGQLAGSMWARSRRGLDGRCWAEVYCGSAESGSWVHVDPLTGTVDRAQDVEKGCVRTAPMAYVVAFSGNTAKDVTQRYVKSFRAVQKLRDEEWWHQTMQPLRPQTASRVQRPASLPTGSNAEPTKGQQRVADFVAAREDAELQQKFSSELQDIPNTIPAFKSHPRYVLERHIGRYQALKPDTAKLGLHRGEPFYPREALQDLHTVDIWQRRGRHVVNAELAKPAKVVNRRGTKDDPKAASTPEEIEEMFNDDEEDLFKPISPKAPASNETKLYGHWQTVEWIPPQAKDGIVPKNERGNVLCPPLAHALPLGTVHLSDMPRVSLVCKALEIDYAVAMTGFETRGGQSVPVFDGVVVCEEHAEAVQEKYWAAERERQEKAENKARAAAETNWRNLLRSIFTRIKVQGDYADDAGNGSGEVIHDDDGGEDVEGNKEPVVLDDSGEEQPAERPAQPKSGAAAAAAIAAAKADVAAREAVRRTWKDPGMIVDCEEI